ncbi:hypothetical protein V492_02739 [Pseudogymnoascus sp. VKM F-4246]|nr:hypothetical protein V492_02739 [Pseudogymnoascus sp. VKM F-4246]
MADTDPSAPPAPAPPIGNYILGFLLIGLAWGFTTPFIRAAARSHKPPAHPILESARVKQSRIRSAVYGAFFGITDLLRNWRIESYGADYEFAGVFVYGYWRLVCGGEGD